MLIQHLDPKLLPEKTKQNREDNSPNTEYNVCTAFLITSRLCVFFLSAFPDPNVTFPNRNVCAPFKSVWMCMRSEQWVETRRGGALGVPVHHTRRCTSMCNQTWIGLKPVVGSKQMLLIWFVIAGFNSDLFFYPKVKAISHRVWQE